jgi:hypothetical protein
MGGLQIKKGMGFSSGVIIGFIEKFFSFVGWKQ